MGDTQPVSLSDSRFRTVSGTCSWDGRAGSQGHEALGGGQGEEAVVSGATCVPSVLRFRDRRDAAGRLRF